MRVGGDPVDWLAAADVGDIEVMMPSASKVRWSGIVLSGGLASTTGTVEGLAGCRDTVASAGTAVVFPTGTDCTGSGSAVVVAGGFAATTTFSDASLDVTEFVRSKDMPLLGAVVRSAINISFATASSTTTSSVTLGRSALIHFCRQAFSTVDDGASGFGGSLDVRLSKYVSAVGRIGGFGDSSVVPVGSSVASIGGICVSCSFETVPAPPAFVRSAPLCFAGTMSDQREPAVTGTAAFGLSESVDACRARLVVGGVACDSVGCAIAVGRPGRGAVGGVEPACGKTSTPAASLTLGGG